MSDKPDYEMYSGVYRVKFLTRIKDCRI